MEATAPVTVERAAALLGVSPSTVHRRIRNGVLKAEQVARPQGIVWLVHLPPGTAAATEDPPPPAAPEATAPTVVAPAAEAMVSLIQTTIATVLGPLVGQLDAQRQTIKRQADRVAELERENGRQAAELERAASIAVTLSDELEALKAARPPVEARTASESPEPTRSHPRPGGAPCGRGGRGTLVGMAEQDQHIEPATPQPVIDEEDPSRGPKPGHGSEDGGAGPPRS